MDKNIWREKNLLSRKYEEIGVTDGIVIDVVKWAIFVRFADEKYSFIQTE